MVGVLPPRPWPRITSLRPVAARLATQSRRRRRQRSETRRRLNVARGKSGHDADGRRTNGPLLVEDIPITDVASGEIERHRFALPGLQHDLVEASKHLHRRVVLIGGLRKTEVDLRDRGPGDAAVVCDGDGDAV